MISFKITIYFSGGYCDYSPLAPKKLGYIAGCSSRIDHNLICIYIYTCIYAYRLKFYMGRKLYEVTIENGSLEGYQQNASQEGPRSSEFVQITLVLRK